MKKLIKTINKLVKNGDKIYDADFLSKDVNISKRVHHNNWQNEILDIANKPGCNILEVGSRSVTGKSIIRSRFDNANYVGFDYYDGHNVDVVGDAHKLSSYFSEGCQFDLVFSSACFEHFAMPWIVSALNVQ